MSHATTKLRSYAESLIRYEGMVNPPSPTQRATVLPVLDKLRPLLATFMGRAGYHALVFRALVLAREEASWLSVIEINLDGSLENFAQLADNHESAEVTHGSEVLLAHLISLLVAFIGEVLTLRLLRELWPDLPNSIDFTHGNEHE